jgi:hypothetical protein
MQAESNDAAGGSMALPMVMRWVLPPEALDSFGELEFSGVGGHHPLATKPRP